MDLPNMLAMAKTFCSVQPCTRYAEGDLVLESDAGKQVIPICPRHYEYYIEYFNSETFDSDILGKETVFVDDVGDDEMIGDIIRRGNPHEIIRP